MKIRNSLLQARAIKKTIPPALKVCTLTYCTYVKNHTAFFKSVHSGSRGHTVRPRFENFSHKQLILPNHSLHNSSGSTVYHQSSSNASRSTLQLSHTINPYCKCSLINIRSEHAKQEKANYQPSHLRRILPLDPKKSSRYRAVTK